MATMSEWVEAFAAAVGQPAPSADEVDEILTMAGTAAHASVRQAAPVTCWLAAAAGLSSREAGAIAREVAETLQGPAPA